MLTFSRTIAVNHVINFIMMRDLLSIEIIEPELRFLNLIEIHFRHLIVEVSSIESFKFQIYSI